VPGSTKSPPRTEVRPQPARRGGATVIGTLRRSEDLDLVDPAVVSHAAAALDAVVAAYGTRADRTALRFWPLRFTNVTLRLLGSDDFPAGSRRRTARDPTTVAAAVALAVAVSDRSPSKTSPRRTTVSTPAGVPPLTSVFREMPRCEDEGH
jgi:hypothetical protein